MRFSIFANGALYESDFVNAVEAIDRAQELVQDYEFLTVVNNDTRKIYWVSDFHVQTYLMKEKDFV